MKTKPIIYPATLHNKYGKVHIYKMGDGRGGVIHTVVWHVGRVRSRKSFADELAAHNHAELVLEQFKNGQPLAGRLTVSDAMYFELCRKRLGSTPLMTAVEHYLNTHGSGDTSHDTPLSVVRDAFLKDLKLQGNSPVDIRTCTSHLSQFCEALNMPITAVKASDIDTYLGEKKCSNRTKKNTRITLCRLWNWAKSKGYLPKHMDSAAKESSSYKAERAASPGIFTPEQLSAMLDVVSDEWLPYFVISAFAGLRQAEVLRLSWEDINLDEKVIILGANVTKTNKRRVVHLSENLIKWLQSESIAKLREVGGPVCPGKDPNKQTRSVSAKTKIPWVDNGLRHSYISYQMALWRDSAKVAEQCGNSASEVQASYKANALESEATKWFSIEPA